MNIELDPIEARVIGSLMEKSMITPEHYPLSLNALVNACNQKSSREPVMDLAEREVVDALERLQSRYLVREKSTFGARVAKYHYRLFNDEIGDFRFSGAERAVVCLLLLRGPQTPGELRSRAGRMYAFAQVDEVEDTLEALRHYEQGPFVAPLARQPGRREIRYTHLFGAATPDAPAADHETTSRRAAAAPAPGEDLAERVTRLEQRVADLERVLAGVAGSGSSSGDP
ncbi:MAG: DUF480 domain-containing protein [Gammaproteobacteria bacterium]|nr:DUF480 domain-containing protein [Gammaproteobacteria bacterium]